jgi:hypothetical protein
VANVEEREKIKLVGASLLCYVLSGGGVHDKQVDAPRC